MIKSQIEELSRLESDMEDALSMLCQSTTDEDKEIWRKIINGLLRSILTLEKQIKSDT